MLLTVAVTLAGCGVVIGTALDKTVDVVRYPVQEFVFRGAYKHDNPWEEPWQPIQVREERGDTLLGLCFSGGGSRSAYFATCVLEELGHRKVPGTDKTYLEEIDFISSVSGGSLAAVYYCRNRARAGFPVDQAEFFDRMRADMSLDFETRGIGRMLLGYWAPLLLTYYDRGDLMASVWDANLFDDSTFADLPPDAPTLLINATTYDTAQRFVFTRLPREQIVQPRFDSIVGRARELTRGYAGSYDPEEILTLESIDSSVAHCPLSTAVVASAAVPNLLGPVNLLDHRRGITLHLGDGGLYDNHGIETLISVIAPIVRKNPDRPALILVVDAAGYFDTGEEAGDVTTIAEFADRTLEISWLRAAALFESSLQLGLERLHAKDLLLYGVISLYDQQAASERQQQSWTDSLLKKVDYVNPVELMTQVRAIGTRFSLEEEAIAAIDSAAPRAVSGALERLEKMWFKRPAPD